MPFQKNTAVTGFAVGLVSASDGSDITTGTPVGYYTLDGGVQTAIGDVTPVHEGSGLWSFDLLQGEMNGDIVALTFTHTSAITQHFTIKTETVLVSDLNNFNAASDTVANVTLVATTTTNTDVTALNDIAATDIVTNGAITTLTGAVSNVTLTDTTTTNTDMRGTNDAALATALSTAQSDLDIITGTDGAIVATSEDIATATALATVDGNVDAILLDTAEIANLNDIAATDVVSAGAITTSLGAVSNVILTDTTTTNTDMRGTNDAALATALATAQSDLDIITGTDGSIIASGQTVSTVTDITNTVDAAIVAIIGGDAGPADNFEKMYDGTGYTDETAPASRAQLSGISSGSAAISKIADSVENVVGTETGTVINTQALDGSVYSIAINGTIAVDFVFNVGSTGIPTEILWDGYASAQGSSYIVQMYNYATIGWDGVGTISGASGTTVYQKVFQATSACVGTAGAEVGEVKLRVTSSNGTVFATDRVLCSYAIVNQSVGYAEGAIWVKDGGSTGTVIHTDGTADNPVVWAAALTLSASSLGIKKFNIANGTDIVLDAAITDFTMYGTGWTLALASQLVGGAYIEGALVTGTGLEGASRPKFHDCDFGAVFLPPARMKDCGYGDSSGTFTGTDDGQYVINNGISLVPGSGSPNLVFTGTLAATGINNRGWKGGSNYTLDSNCTLSHEVLVGGGTTITTGGGDAEIRGITRSLTLILSGSETVQFVGTTGVIDLSGTTTATVNLYGVAASVTDTTITATVTDDTVNAVNIDAIIADIGTIDGKLPSALVSGRMNSNVSAINDNNTSAINLAASAEGIHPDVVTGVPTDITLNLTNGSTVDDVYNGRIIIITSGTNAGLGMAITDYDGASGLCTYDATITVASGDNLVIV